MTGTQLGRRPAEIALAEIGADEFGLAPAQFLVLQDLFLNGHSSISEIAGRAGLAQSRVSTSAREFVDRGWARTTADPADGRKTLAELTDEVKAAGAQRRVDRADLTLAQALSGVTAVERHELIQALDRLHRLLVSDDAPRRFPDAAAR
ncbi:MarR family winged helix-turn-helix transcriptional regulator [Nocardia terpenica]|uniref:HTH marR-type domain-containing protein n=1 Tax=Nocardia terpenica TaxID=455432 RepID=A0A164LS80_9NOCA|nr:MarR family transcriptional regulator [Nocardia terpenica]KZM72701.1 hypothetical protein AWN90_28380 [Nocardia terpenica]NQE92394.1 MarR family transcriptional regulator [Nocardia terpenica]